MVVINGVHWIANLRGNDQTLLGSTFVTLKTHVSELDKLSPAQDQEFVVIRNALIRAMRVSFQPLTINTSCLKNNAFKIAPDDTPPGAAHVHWHFKPRYGTKPMIINDEVFNDPLPGNYLSSFERRTTSKETSRLIAATLRGNLPEMRT